MTDLALPESEFLANILDSLQDHVAVLDQAGTIVYVNAAWEAFGTENGLTSGVSSWLESNYLEVCDRAAGNGHRNGAKAARGIRQVLQDPEHPYYLEYPCHSPDQKRWFMMRVTAFSHQGERLLVVAHSNITERKLVERKMERLSRLDALTGIDNRRNLKRVLGSEWNRCKRDSKPISVAMLDIDHFKGFNDQFGHQAGDTCLKKIADTLAQHCKRPGDHCARFGGEEFTVVMANMPKDAAAGHLEEILEAVREQQIPNPGTKLGVITISAGLATRIPVAGDRAAELLAEADQALYEAKRQGRDQVIAHSSEALESPPNEQQTP